MNYICRLGIGGLAHSLHSATDRLPAAVAEAIDIVRSAASAIGHWLTSGTWWASPIVVDRIEVRSRGVDVAINIPKIAGPLAAFPAADLAARRGNGCMLSRLPVLFALRGVKNAEVGFNNWSSRILEAIRIAFTVWRGKRDNHRRYCESQNFVNSAVFDIIIADKGSTRILVRCMSGDDVRTIASEPTATVGSDGPCVSPYGVTGQGKPHPRLMARSLV